MDSWETEGFVKYDEKKEKYTYQAPTKESVVRWIPRAYEETIPRTIKNGNFLSILWVKFLGFKKAGGFDNEQQNLILNEGLKLLYIVNEKDEFVHIEKDSIGN